MAMTLRLSPEDSLALERIAALEGASQQATVIKAVREYIERSSHAHLLREVMDRELPRYAEALERLGK